MAEGIHMYENGFGADIIITFYCWTERINS